MNPKIQALLPTSPDCRWCRLATATVIFEDAYLCDQCCRLAIIANENPSLCHKCNTLFVDSKMQDALLGEDGLSHSTADELRRAAQEGCKLCRVMLLQDSNPDPNKFLVDPLVLFAQVVKGLKGVETESPSTNGFTEDINAIHFDSEQEIFRLTMSVSASSDNLASNYISQRPIERDLGSKEVTAEVRSWMQECTQNHLDCIRNNHTGFFPTRVLDIKSINEIKIVETSSTSHGKYLALSYCWGVEPFAVTTIANIEARKHNLSVAELPKTFLDAIEVTVKLGFQYLWIDALCIIDDDLDDRLQELGVMHQIYGNAVLTIAAVSAPGVSNGFLTPARPLSVELPYRCPDGAIGSVQLAARRNVDLLRETLYTRAWCLQECLLSPRMLLYTDMEVLWQCHVFPVKRRNTTHVTYDYESPERDYSPFKRLPKEGDRPISNQKTIPLGVNVSTESTPQGRPTADAENYKTWKCIVENYTRRKITKSTDWLPALSGVAQKLKHSWDDDYYAGIWKRHFISSLTWHRTARWMGPKENTDERYAPLLDYRAPSWSWASIDGPVEFDVRFDLGDIKGAKAELIYCEVNPVAANAPLGELNGGKAVFKASLLPAAQLPLRIWLDNAAGGDLNLDDGNPKIASVLTEEMLQYGSVMLLGSGPDGGGRMTRTTALVLMPVGDNFKRVGYWQSTDKGASKIWPRNKSILTII